MHGLHTGGIARVSIGLWSSGYEHLASTDKSQVTMSYSRKLRTGSQEEGIATRAESAGKTAAAHGM